MNFTIDKMHCEQLKNLGNEQFKEGNFKSAIEFFDKAIKADPDNHILYSNRSAAYLSLGKGKLALQDAEKCIELNPKSCSTLSLDLLSFIAFPL